MADAYDVMNLAKRYGASARNLEAWQSYQDDLRRFQEKKGKGSFWGGLAQLGMAAAIPMLLPATGGTVLGMLSKGMLRGGLTKGISDLVGNIAEGNIMGDSSPTKFKGTGGYWGMGQEKEMGRKSREIERSIASGLASANRSKWFSSLLAGFSPELKGGMDSEWAKKLREVGGDIKENLGILKGNKSAMDLITSTPEHGVSFSAGAPTSLEDSLNQILEEELGGGFTDRSIGNVMYESGAQFGTPSQYSGANELLAPLSVADKSPLPYQIPAPEITTGGKLPYSPYGFNMPTTGGGLDTTNILENIGLPGYTAPWETSSNLSNIGMGKGNPQLSLLQQLLQGYK